MAWAAEALTDGNLQGLTVAIAEMGRHVEGQRERIRLLEAVIENFPGGISLFDRNMQMVMCNERQKRLLDYPDALFANGFPTLEELFPLQRSAWRVRPRRRQRTGRAARGACSRSASRMSMSARGPTARSSRCAACARSMGGGFVTTYFDVTEQRRTQALVAHMAHHDTLTDLPNRALFSDRLQTAVALARRSGLMAVHYLDIDNFKPVNDNLGHKAGDELLISVAGGCAARCATTTRWRGWAATNSAIVQTGIRAHGDAAVLAKRILAQISTPFRITGKEVRVGVSIGIAFASLDGLNTDDVLAKADTVCLLQAARPADAAGSALLQRGAGAA